MKTTDSIHPFLVAHNLIARESNPTRKNYKWTADITYIPTEKGWMYLVAVEDQYSRKIVGWSMSERIDSRLVVAALEIAIQSERPKAALQAHSDHCVQYTSEHYQALLKRRGNT